MALFQQIQEAQVNSNFEEVDRLTKEFNAPENRHERWSNNQDASKLHLGEVFGKELLAFRKLLDNSKQS